MPHGILDALSLALIVTKQCHVNTGDHEFDIVIGVSMDHAGKHRRALAWYGMSRNSCSRPCCPSSPRSRSSTTTATACCGPEATWPGCSTRPTATRRRRAALRLPGRAGVPALVPAAARPAAAREPGSYAERRAALGADEVNRRFLGACGLEALCVDTGYAPGGLLSPAETAGPRRGGGVRDRPPRAGRGVAGARPGRAPPSSPTPTGGR